MDSDYSTTDSPFFEKRKRGRPRKSNVSSNYTPNPSRIQDVSLDEDKSFLDSYPSSSEKSSTQAGKYISPNDPAGYSKLVAELKKCGVDVSGATEGVKDGRLGVTAFQLNFRDSKKWYSIALDLAKHLNFRDSYSFFLKNESLDKIWTSEIERSWLADIGALVPASYRLRNMAAVCLDQVFPIYKSQLAYNNQAPIEYEDFGDEEQQIGDEDNLEEEDQLSRSRKRYFVSTAKRSDKDWMKSAFETCAYNAQLTEERRQRLAYNASVKDALTALHMIPFRFTNANRERVVYYDPYIKSTHYPIAVMPHQRQDNFPMFSPQWMNWYSEQIKRKPA